MALSFSWVVEIIFPEASGTVILPVLQEALTNCFDTGKLLCLLCFPQSMIMHVKYGQEKSTGTHYIEGTDSLSGFRCGTCAEPLSPVSMVALSSVRKCRILHTVDTTVITDVMKINRIKVTNFKFMNYGRFHFYL